MEIYISRNISGLSITKLCLLSVVAAGHFLRFAPCSTHAQWNLNLVALKTNGMPGSQPSVSQTSFISHAYEGICIMLMKQTINMASI